VAQTLVNVVTVTNLAGGATITVAHGLESNGASVVPTLIFPDRPSTIAVQSANATTVTFVNNGGAIATSKFRCERGWQPEVDATTVTPLLYAGATAATGLGGNILWCVVGGAYATLQDAVNAASSGDTILVGPNAAGWGDVVFPAQKLLSVSGISGAAHSNTTRIGKVTYSPAVGTVSQNNIWMENLYVAGDFNGSQGILFAGTAPARMRITGMFISNSSGVGGNCVVSNNSGVGSSLYLDNCLTDDGTVGTMLVHTQGFTQVQDTELHAGSVAFSCAAGTLTIYNTRAEYALAGAVGVITGGTVSATSLFVRNTTAGGSGISVANPGVLILDGSVFDVATGAGYCVSGNGTFLYGQVTFTNVAVVLPRNVKTQQTLNGGAGAIQMTQLPTNTP
jgi:hypothetical protein